MNDEELGQFLRGEIPAPKGDYWADIDAALASADPDVTVEFGAGGTDDPGAPDQVSEKSEPEWETEAEVIRLTDMNTNMIPISHRARTLWLSVAAALFVVVGGFAVVLATENSDSTATAANSDDQNGTGQDEGDAVISSESTTIQPETADQAGDGEAGDGDDNTDGDNSGDEDTESAPTTTAVADEDAVYWDFTYGSAINMRAEPSFDGIVIGQWAGDERAILGTGRSEIVADYEWTELTYQWSLDGARETGWVGREFLAASTTPSDINDAVITEGDPQVWNFVSNGRVEARTWPGFGGLIQGSWAGDEAGIEGTGRTAIANSMQWVELAAGEERAEGWVVRDVLEPADLDRSLVCYSSGGDAMVLQFADDAMTFVGALRITSDFGPEYFGVAGRRTVGTAFEVAVQSNGETETSVQEWLATGDGMSAGNLAFVDAVGCGLIPDDVTELDQTVLSYPDTP